MFFRKVKYILITVYFLSGVSIFIPPAKALPLIGNIYGSVGGAFSKDDFSGYITQDIKNNFTTKNNYHNNVNLALGLASKLPMSIINNLRLELNYIQSLNKASSKILGAALYYDIKVIPFLEPYIGFSLLYTTPSVVLENNNKKIKERINQGLTSINVGANFTMPLFPLSLYAEYKYAMPGVFKNNLSFNNSDIKYNSNSYHVSIIAVGVRFYFL